MRHNPSSRRSWLPPAQRTEEAHGFSTLPSCHLFLHPIALVAPPISIALTAEAVHDLPVRENCEPQWTFAHRDRRAEATTEFIAPGSLGGPRRAGHVSQCRERLLRPARQSARTPRLGDHRRTPYHPSVFRDDRLTG